MTDEIPVKPTKGAGRPKYEPTDEQRRQTRLLAAMGTPHTDIAKIIGCSPKTLRRAYRAELDTGAAEANAKVAQSLFRQATDPKKPNVAAGIFWMKARAGWFDRPAPGETETPAVKEKRRQDAQRVGSGQGRFAPGKGPRLVVSNS